MWNEKDINEAIKLNAEGKRFEEIGISLDRSYDSVRLKLLRLGYKENIINKYEEITCLNCGGKCERLKSRGRKFCSQSCSATHNNKKRCEERFCEICGKKLKWSQMYTCSEKCMGMRMIKKRNDKIESGCSSYNEQTYRRYLIEKHSAKCWKCGWNEIHEITGKVPIQLNHIDGNSENNSLDNLELLCPNHHSLTSNFGGLNKGYGRKNRYK